MLNEEIFNRIYQKLYPPIYRAHDDISTQKMLPFKSRFSRSVFK